MTTWHSDTLQNGATVALIVQHHDASREEIAAALQSSGFSDVRVYKCRAALTDNKCVLVDANGLLWATGANGWPSQDYLVDDLPSMGLWRARVLAVWRGGNDAHSPSLSATMAILNYWIDEDSIPHTPPPPQPPPPKPPSPPQPPPPKPPSPPSPPQPPQPSTPERSGGGALVAAIAGIAALLILARGRKKS